MKKVTIYYESEKTHNELARELSALFNECSMIFDGVQNDENNAENPQIAADNR